MSRLTTWAVRRPRRAVGVWVLLLALLGTLALTAGGSYDDSFTLPDTESSRAQTILQEKFPATSSATATVAIGNAGAAVTDPAVVTAAEELLTDIAQIPGVTQVVSPFSEAGTAQGLVAPDGTLASAQVVFDGALEDVATADAQELFDLAQAASDAGLQVGLSGQVTDLVQGAPPVVSELVGIGVALLVMLFLFGAVVAAGLPVLIALVGLGAGLAVVTVAANALTIATFAPTLAVMIGLGVGIDYGLFVIGRFRTALLGGKTPTDAALEASATAGRAVVFAASAVVIALAGLFVLGISFMNGLAIAAGATVVMVMLSAVVLLPAVLALLGHRVMKGKIPGADRRAAKEGQGFGRYAVVLQRRPAVAAALGTVAMLVVAAPVLGLSSGFPDASVEAEGSLKRVAYDLTADANGAGALGPFLIATELGTPGDLGPVEELSRAVAADPGVVAVSPPVPSEDGTAALLTVQPTTGPQDSATSTTLDRLRTDVIPTVLDGTGTEAFVGGQTAITTDFGSVLTDALPLFLLVVLGLGFLALVVLFRSLLVPALGVLTSLLSLGAGLGVTVAVFQWGWLAGLFGVSGSAPIIPFLPIMIFAILFGLAMDYQVFLASRMQEEYGHTKDARRAVRAGLIGSGRVVAGAAVILAAVFLAFVFGDDRIIKSFGLALGVGVLLDAFVVRLVVVPAVMTMLGDRAWWLPRWMDRVLPTISVEGGDETAAASPVDDADDADDVDDVHVDDEDDDEDRQRVLEPVG